MALVKKSIPQLVCSAVGEKGRNWVKQEKYWWAKQAKWWSGLRGNGLQSQEACLWCRPSIISDSGIMLWLVKCLNVDRFALFQNHASSIIGKRVFLKQRFWAIGIQISLQDFLLIPQLKEEQKICVWSVAKKKSFQISSSFYTLQSVINCDHIYKLKRLSYTLYKPTFKRHSIIITCSWSYQRHDKTQKAVDIYF